MKDKSKLIIGALFLAAALIFGTLLYNALLKDFSPSFDNAQSGERVAAPDFTVVDGSSDEIKLSDYKGKGVVINFWATWCGYCVQEMPDFEEAFKKYGDDVQFMMVNMPNVQRETIEKAQQFIQDGEYTFPVFYDTMQQAATAYEVSGLPCTYFIDKDGNIAASTIGRISAEQLEQSLQLILE